MGKIHTHYDNLNVARNAPAEVIQAAYRALSLKFHPDRNPDNPEAARIMALINVAYSVLSDPAKRAEHDQWIARQEAQQEPARPSSGPQGSASQASPGEGYGPGSSRSAYGPGASSGASSGASAGSSDSSASQNGQGFRPTGHAQAGGPGAKTGSPQGRRSFLRRYWLLVVIAVLVGVKLWWTSAPKQEQPAPEAPATAQKRQPAPKRPAPKPEPAAIPEPQPQPQPREPEPAPVAVPNSAANRCRVVMDNRLGGKALVARLVRVGEGQGEVVREFSVPARGEVNVRNVPPGTYEVRFRNPATGETKKTETFTLRETQTPEGGVKSDVLTFTTYSVPGGNMRTLPIGEGEY